MTSPPKDLRTGRRRGVKPGTTGHCGRRVGVVCVCEEAGGPGQSSPTDSPLPAVSLVRRPGPGSPTLFRLARASGSSLRDGSEKGRRFTTSGVGEGDVQRKVPERRG